MLSLSELELSIGKPLFSGLSCHLKSGHFVLLRGQSGVGKSSLLRSMAGLESRAKGEIHWLGKSLADEEFPRFRGQAIYVSQTPPRWQMSVEESLQLAFQFKSQHGVYDREVALSFCQSLNLESSILKQSLIALSGGEAKRIALVRAMLLHPKVLLLDEPASGLDTDSAEAMGILLKSWVNEGGHALLCATHQVAWCQDHAHESWTLLPGGAIDLETLR